MEKLIMPRWELSDPFGRGEIRRLSYELRVKSAQLSGMRIELEECYHDRAAVVNKLVEEIQMQRADIEELKRRIKLCDQARKNLGDKLRSAVAKIAELEGGVQHDEG